MREDACVVSRDNAPENLSIIRRFILNMLKLDTAHPKKSVRLRPRGQHRMMMNVCVCWE